MIGIINAADNWINAGEINSVDASKGLVAEAGDLGPEGLKFIPAEQSPNGMNLLVVANEVSGTTTIYQIEL